MTYVSHLWSDMVICRFNAVYTWRDWEFDLHNCRRETEKISLQRDVSESLENIVLFTPNTLESNFANRNLSQF